MTAKKKKKEESPQAGPKPITLGTIKTIFMRAVENPQRGVPTLIGPPQWGKTHYIREWLLEQGADRIAMINPQSDMPEDVAGWPVRSRGKLSFTNPSGIPAELLRPKAPPWALFIDELDKAKDDTLSAMLTLLNPGERRLRETYIPSKVPVVVAMNEPRRELPEPLVARLLFIPFPPAGFTMDVRVANSTVLSPPAVSVPQRPHAPGSYFKLKEWFSIPEFGQDEAVRRAVVSGLFPAAAVPGVLEGLEDSFNFGTNWAKTCTVEELHSMIFLVLGHCNTAEEISDIFADLQKRADEDATEEFGKALLHILACSEEAKEIRVLKPEERDVAELRARGERVAKAYKEEQNG